MNKCDLIDLYDHIISCLNNIFNNLEGISGTYLYDTKDKKIIENKNLNNILYLAFYIFDSTISYLYEPLIKKYIDKIFDFFENKRNMFRDEYINIFKKDIYVLIIDFYRKIYNLEKKITGNVEYIIEKEKYILDSLLKLLKVNKITIRKYVIEEINEKYLKEGIKYENKIKTYIKTYIEENNLCYDIINNKLINNNVYKIFGREDNYIFSMNILKDGRLIASIEEKIIIFNKNDFSVDLEIDEFNSTIYYFTVVDNDRIIASSGKIYIIKLLDKNKYEIIQTIKSEQLDDSNYLKIIQIKNNNLLLGSYWNGLDANLIEVYKYNNEKQEYIFFKNIENFFEKNNSGINLITINNETELVCSNNSDGKIIFLDIPSFNINLIIKNINIESFSTSMIYDEKNNLLFACGEGILVFDTKKHKILCYFNLDINTVSIYLKSNGNILIGTYGNSNSKLNNNIEDAIFEINYSKERNDMKVLNLNEYNVASLAITELFDGKIATANIDSINIWKR